MVDSMFSAYDTTLNQGIDLLTRMKELVLGQASSAAATDATRDSVAIELISLRQELLNIANYQVGDRFIYSGSLDTTQAFSDITIATTPGAVNGGGAVASGSVANPVDARLGDTYRIAFTGLRPGSGCSRARVGTPCSRLARWTSSPLSTK